MNTKPPSIDPVPLETRPSDVEIVRASQPSDYTGTTSFAQMIELECLRWLDMAVEFVRKCQIELSAGIGSPTEFMSFVI